jgi:hypothetical protein
VHGQLGLEELLAFDAKLVDKAIKDLGIDPEKKNPAIS